MSSRKIPREYDNPIDNILIDIAEYLNPFFYKLNFSPNDITTLSLIFGLLMLYCYHKNLYIYAAILWLISYLFDCQDGNYARKYGLQTEFGDAYDHIKDWSIFILLIVLFIQKKTSTKFKITSFIILSVLLFLSNIHVGCKEVYIKKNTDYENSTFLQLISISCTNDKNLYITRHFGVGTLNLAIAIIILLHHFQK